MTPQQLTNPEIEIIPPDISHLVIEDDTPVDNFQSAQQQRLLVESIYGSQAVPPPFIADANVGVFYSIKGDPVVPDAFLSLGIERPADFSQRQNRSYFVWELGKVPEVCIEIVSNAEGDELTLSNKSRQKGKTASKKEIYARIGVTYYVVFDPLRQIQGKDAMDGQLLRVFALMAGRYIELDPPFWLESVGLGLTLWQGEFEGKTDLWLRWCDREGNIIPTGAERAEAEQQRAEAEQQRAEAERQRAEAEQQRAELERQRAEAERQRAEAEQQRAELEQQRADRLAERLRQLGINPDEI
jgi:hypothetical protein